MDGDQFWATCASWRFLRAYHHLILTETFRQCFSVFQHRWLIKSTSVMNGMDEWNCLRICRRPRHNSKRFHALENVHYRYQSRRCVDAAVVLPAAWFCLCKITSIDHRIFETRVLISSVYNGQNWIDQLNTTEYNWIKNSPLLTQVNPTIKSDF